LNGKQEGVGIYYNAKGELRYGRWANGKRVAWIQEGEYNQAIQEYNKEA
jgi:hypothetical protein